MEQRPGEGDGERTGEEDGKRKKKRDEERRLCEEEWKGRRGSVVCGE